MRASVCVPRNCSGAMYAGVPIMAPVRVSCASKAPELLWMSSPDPPADEGELSTRVEKISPSGRGPDPVRVGVERCMVTAGMPRSVVPLFSVTWRASPKSMTRTWLSRPTMTLSGLKSRCTRPLSCAAASPRPAALNTFTISCQLRVAACSQ